jgi:hypothetical protein
MANGETPHFVYAKSVLSLAIPVMLQALPMIATPVLMAIPIKILYVKIAQLIAKNVILHSLPTFVTQPLAISTIKK